MKASLATALVLVLGVAGCTATPPAEDALYYRAPIADAAATTATTRSPDEIAQILRDAGLGSVRADAGSVTLNSSDPRLVDCGIFVQVARGNRAEFPANASLAVFMQGFRQPGLVERAVETRSTVRLTKVDGAGYSIAESHTVTRRYQAVETGARSVSRVTFDGTSEGVFPNTTSCRASGLVADLLR